MSNSLAVQSLHRAFDILEAIGNSVAPASLKEITETTGLPKSTVYRLISNLETRDYVCCDNNGKYRLGFQLFMMSQWAEKDFQVKRVARAFLESLNEFTKETVHLGIFWKNRVLYVDTVESPHALRLVAKLGSTNSVHCTALGKVLLMKHSEEEICAILEEQGMEKRTGYTLCTPVDYLREMAVVGKVGYALDNRESEMDSRCVGAPIYNNTGEIVAAISISGLATRFSYDFIVKEVVSRLLDSTARISRVLGYVD
jgi:DNA-binding IclR family transcriptional regulator